MPKGMLQLRVEMLFFLVPARDADPGSSHAVKSRFLYRLAKRGSRLDGSGNLDGVKFVPSMARFIGALQSIRGELSFDPSDTK